MTPEEERDAIAKAFPTHTGRHNLWAEAMRLVGERHAKGDLVELVNWLLLRNDESERARREAESARASFLCQRGGLEDQVERAEAALVAANGTIDALRVALDEERPYRLALVEERANRVVAEARVAELSSVTLTDDKLKAIELRAHDRAATNSVRGYFVEPARGASVTETLALIAEVLRLRAQRKPEDE